MNSILKNGTRCVIVAGCPENIGLIVVVLERLGRHGGRVDGYLVRTVTGRKFNQMWDGNDLLRGYSDECVTDRHKLRPLVDPGDEVLEAPPVVAQTPALSQFQQQLAKTGMTREEFSKQLGQQFVDALNKAAIKHAAKYDDRGPT